LKDIDDFDVSMGFYQLFIAGKAIARKGRCRSFHYTEIGGLTDGIPRVIAMVPSRATAGWVIHGQFDIFTED
jgi:hypothetical protein